MLRFGRRAFTTGSSTQPTPPNFKITWEMVKQNSGIIGGGFLVILGMGKYITDLSSKIIEERALDENKINEERLLRREAVSLAGKDIEYLKSELGKDIEYLKSELAKESEKAARESAKESENLKALFDARLASIQSQADRDVERERTEVYQHFYNTVYHSDHSRFRQMLSEADQSNTPFVKNPNTEKDGVNHRPVDNGSP